MLKENDLFIQQLQVESGARRYEHRTTIDLVIGSGRHGQSYLYWQGNQLYVHQVGYFAELQDWTNSPRYPDGVADLARPVIPTCLNCHSTYFAADPGAVNRFDREQFLLGVTCVRCHGPGNEHVQYHREHPDSQAQAIVNPSTLTREREMDVCGHCHLGPEVLKAFQFRPGDRLSDHLPADLPAGIGETLHSGAQMSSLIRSKCYQNSEMTCTTCHDPHRIESSAEIRHRSCLPCHEVSHCAAEHTLGAAELREKCVDCHMPLTEVTSFTIATPGGLRARHLHDHFIRQPDAPKPNSPDF